MLAGDPPAAERELREAIRVAEKMGAARYVALYHMRIARVLSEQGRHDQAAVELRESANLYGKFASWKAAQARVLAAQGNTEAAVALAREAAALRAGDDDLTGSAETFVDVAVVLPAAGDRPGAVAALEEAIGLHEEKGNVVAAAQCRERLTAIA
jgi:Flp pilus assembly protein TadD